LITSIDPQSSILNPQSSIHNPRSHEPRPSVETIRKGQTQQAVEGARANIPIPVGELREFTRDAAIELERVLLRVKSRTRRQRHESRGTKHGSSANGLHNRPSA
jgi:hypothetical protein